MEKKIFKFGEISSKVLITVLFYTGIIPIIHKSIAFGKTVYLSNTYQRTVKVGDYYTEKEVNNLLLGVFEGLVLFIVLVIFWKVVCELLYIIIRYFEKPNDNKEDSK